MAVSKLKWRVTEIATCPICLDEFVEAKSLPCVHSFCLKCLEGHCKDKSPGQSVDCPVCRTKFVVPENGIPGLPHNFFLKNLIDAKKATGDEVGERHREVPCDVCMKEEADELDTVPPASVYCVDCCQKLCKPCSRPHKLWIGGPHQLRDLATVGKTELLQQHRNRCEKHEFKFIELYCFDCRVNLCMKCFAVGHTQHKCGEIEQVADEFCKHIDTDIKLVQQRLYEFTAAMATADSQCANFIASAERVENEVVEIGEKLKRMIDKHVNEVQQEVQNLKSATIKEIEAQKDRLSLALMTLESYTEYAMQLKAKGSYSDVTMAADKLHSRANELLKTFVSPDTYHAPTVAFMQCHVLNQLVSSGQNVIGSMSVKELAGSLL